MHIKIENLSHSFGDKVVLSGISFDSQISSLAVIGPSGGGKSTLLRILGGLICPSEGSLFFDGALITCPLDPSLRKKAGFVFQNNGLFPHLSGFQNITLPLIHVYHMLPDEAADIAQTLLARFGLGAHAEKFPYELSGGQQQRIAIARAVAPRPELLLLDEPTSALDPEFTSEVLEMINELQKEGLNIILVTHEMGFARNACDKTMFLSEGGIREYAPSAEFFGNPKNPDVKAFLHRVLEWN